MNRNTAIKLNSIIGQMVMGARELMHGSRIGNKTLIREMEQLRSDAAELLVNEIEDSFKPKLIVVAYKTQAHEHPVLQVMLDDHGTRTLMSAVYSRDDAIYSSLLNACCGCPLWIYECTPEPLV